MKLPSVIAPFVLALGLTAPFANAQEWHTDYEKASQLAAKENKLLLMDFTGSDWCGWCIKLDNEVFAMPEFKEFARQNLVLLKLDFPRSKDQPEAEKKQNEALMQKHGIQGFPTIIVLNPKGERVGKLGYMPGGPSAFIDEVRKLKS